MFSKNLRFYRLKAKLNRSELAKRAGVSAALISYYEQGERKPQMDVIKALARELHVRVSDFLAIRNNNLHFTHGEFRKNSRMSKGMQEYIRECVEEYMNRFFIILELLGGEVLPKAPACKSIPVTKNAEDDSLALRISLGFSADGPIEYLIGKLENKGLLIYALDIDEHDFSGMNGFVNDIPYIVINSNMTAERKRSTIMHELSHLMFNWSDCDFDEQEIEKHSTAIGGAFLFPKIDAKRELGLHRDYVSSDMIMVAKEYGISMFLLIKRAALIKIITSQAEKSFYIKASKLGWKNNEPSRINDEMPLLFNQLVYRAVTENAINIQKAAELLKCSYESVSENIGKI